MSKPKILVLDIETKPALLYGWGMFKQNFGIEQVKAPPEILCVCAKWVGEKEVITLTEWDDGYKTMLQEVANLIQEADAVIGKNSDRFDLPWLHGEFMKHRIQPPAPTTSIDLEKTLRFKMRFLSNKLDYVVQELGIGKKLDTGGFKLWNQVMEGNEKARKKMVRYCVRDVRVTEKLYKVMIPYMPNHPHLGEIGKRECGACGSNHVHVSKWRRTKSMRIQQLHCQSCGSYFDGIKQKVN